MNTRKQGAIGVAKAIGYFAENGYGISLPISDIQRYDLIVDKANALQRVECKTSSYKRTNYYYVGLKTNGGNQTGAQKSKPISSADSELVFIHCLDGTQYLIPTADIDGKSVLELFPKYSKYKIIGS